MLLADSARLSSQPQRLASHEVPTQKRGVYVHSPPPPYSLLSPFHHRRRTGEELGEGLGVKEPSLVFPNPLSESLPSLPASSQAATLFNCQQHERRMTVQCSVHHAVECRGFREARCLKLCFYIPHLADGPRAYTCDDSSLVMNYALKRCGCWVV